MRPAITETRSDTIYTAHFSTWMMYDLVSSDVSSSELSSAAAAVTREKGKRAHAKISQNEKKKLSY